MGSFYGSVQVRSEDRSAIISAAEQVARDRKIKALVGPLLDGWVGIYPENNGQDEGVSEAIAALVSADVLQLMVHDDDVTAYRWWREGKLVDAYWSMPGYFGDEGREREEAQASSSPRISSVSRPTGSCSCARPES
jgi:hypothetical protein